MDGGIDPEMDDRGPFGRPLLKTPASRDLSRVGVVDVGSNSVRLVVFDGAARAPAYFYNEKVMCGLGAGLAETGRLNPKGKIRAMEALRRFQILADGMGLTPLTAVATAAMREAEDGPAFRDEIARETGLRLYVIDGSEEARLSTQGVLVGWPWAEGVVCDIGGSSMELAMVSGGKVGRRQTSPLGPLKLQNLPGGKKQLRKHIDGVMAGLVDTLEIKGQRLYLVGGSWRAIAKLDMARRNYPLRVLHEYELTPDALSETLDHLITTDDLEPLRQEAGVGSDRMSLVPLAAEVLKSVLRGITPPKIVMSSYGLREGLLYEQMPQPLRDRDPLIEASNWLEQHDARVPGFGRVLYHFVRPLFAGAPKAKLRLVRAACLLHDVNWRTHPDYRARVCFDLATRANLGALSHPERIFLGIALLHRYKNGRPGEDIEPMLALLDEDSQKEAQMLGRAMRFGAMFTAQSSQQIGSLDWDAENRRLRLSIGPRGMALFGEVAQGRFAALAKSLGAETEVRTTGGIS
ncbi:MAG: Ppx/GppA family phosphatase [Qingshengfaniella sp.]